MLFKSISVAGIVSILFGCSGKTADPEDAQKQTEMKRLYTTQQLQDKYEHIPKSEYMGVGIDVSRAKFNERLKNTFANIKDYKSDIAQREADHKAQLAKKGKSVNTDKYSPEALARTGKNSLGGYGYRSSATIFKDIDVSGKDNTSPSGKEEGKSLIRLY